MVSIGQRYARAAPESSHFRTRREAAAARAARCFAPREVISLADPAQDGGAFSHVLYAIRAGRILYAAQQQ
jgi:hypothetical protein